MFIILCLLIFRKQFGKLLQLCRYYNAPCKLKRERNLNMEKETFTYSYSAKEGAEIQAIKKRYQPKENDKLSQLRRLDEKVQSAGMIEALCTGIISALVFGFGLCLCLDVFGNGVLNMVIGVLVGLVAMVGMGWAYPLYCRLQKKEKEKYTPQILELIAELSGEK